MKTSLLLAGALLVVTPAVVHAQPQTPSGYELLTQAGGKILPGPNGGASNTDPNISPAENLKRERLAVARNAPALAMVRVALQKPVVIPDETVIQAGFPFNARMRELARQFSQESDVRLADGDYKGAMDSKLDTMELGAAVSHGVLISMFVGAAIEAIGAKGADKVAARLDAAQCHAAATRLSAIEARRVSLEETLRLEQKSNLQMTMRSIGDIKAGPEMKPAEDGEFPTAQDIEQLKKLTPENVTKNYARLFDAVVQASQLSYSKAIVVGLPQDLDPLSKLSRDLFQGGRYLFNYDRLVEQNRLLRSALELRAQKLETGNYPENFVAALDPFSSDGKPLVYRKLGADYLLYSVGPDGVDDGGAEIQTIETHEETGLKSVSDRLQPESTGDIVQTPF